MVEPIGSRRESQTGHDHRKEEKMKRFEVGKTYQVNGGGTITITKRTRCFITFTGSFSGRMMPYAMFENGLFGLGEHIWIRKNSYMKVHCFAGHKEEEKK